MTSPVINTPKGTITVNASGKAELVWNTNFQAKWHRQYSDAQKFVDESVLRLCEPFTPLLTGMMVMSATLGTDVGSGLVSWIAPYSHFQYYHPRKIGTQTGPLRGPFWFERGKQIWGKQVIAGARRIAGGGE